MTDKLPQPNLPPQVGRLLKPGLRFGQAVYSATQMHEYADAYADSAVAEERRRMAQWVRDNYQDHASVAGLCDAMVALGPNVGIEPPRSGRLE